MALDRFDTYAAHQKFKDGTYAQDVSDRQRLEKEHRDNIQRGINGKKSFKDIVKDNVRKVENESMARRAVESFMEAFLSFREEYEGVDEQAVIEMFLENYPDEYVELILQAIKDNGYDFKEGRK
jgi:hypothetical protein